MWNALTKLIYSNRQTKYFFLMAFVFMVALVWTTVQAYARLAYSRSDLQKPILIQIEKNQQS